jgi:hypothetical protein
MRSFIISALDLTLNHIHPEYRERAAIKIYHNFGFETEHVIVTVTHIYTHTPTHRVLLGMSIYMQFYIDIRGDHIDIKSFFWFGGYFNCCST